MNCYLTKESLSLAINHLSIYGDTDVFPYLPEIIFLSENLDDVVNELSTLDLNSYSPTHAFEALAPKSRYGFRIVHQLPYIDTVLLLASVIEIGPLIEASRPETTTAAAFSYRFSPDDSGRLFCPDHTYKDWLKKQQSHILENEEVKTVISTDISDFYSRINFHRLENLLDAAAPAHCAAKYIKKHIKVIRAKQSFGLPVGGSAARLLAELALTDTDMALMNEGYTATRFVDDFRIFLDSSMDPYDALSFLAKLLNINEGLSLNVAKTSVETRGKFQLNLVHQLMDVTDEAAGIAFGQLTTQLYFDDEPDHEELEKLKKLNLLSFLENEISKDNFDIGRIKVIFRALKLAKPQEAIGYIVENFTRLVVFSKELVLLMQVLETDSPGCFDELVDTVIESVLTPPASSVQLIKSWLLELFARGTVKLQVKDLKKLKSLNEVLDKRQTHIIHGHLANTNHFRSLKTSFGQFGTPEQICIILGASCLPKDEYTNWLVGLKPNFDFPTSKLLLDWVRSEQSEIMKKMFVAQ